MYKLRVKVGNTRFVKSFSSFEAVKEAMFQYRLRFTQVTFERINF